MDKQDSLYASLVRTAPDLPALRFGHLTISYGVLRTRIMKMASFLASKGVRSGDVVTTALPNTPETIYVFYALDVLGAVQNIVHPLLPLEKIFATMKETASRLAIVNETLYQDNAARFLEREEDFLFLNPLESFSLKRHLFYTRYKKAPEGAKAPHLSHLGHYRACAPLEEIAPRAKGADALLLHSGGTTGDPKIIALSANALNALASKVPAIVGQESLEHEGMLSVLPLFHGFGLGMGVHSPLSMGACCCLQMKFNPREALRWIDQGLVTMMIGVPTLYQKLSQEPLFAMTNVTRLKHLFIGGDKVPPSLISFYDDFLSSHGSAGRMLEGYGLTETVTVCSVNTRENSKARSVGRALSGITMEVRDKLGKTLEKGEIGEVFVKGDTTMNGYYHDEEATRKTLREDSRGTWVATGDLGYMDPDGFLFLKGREKRVFIIAGFNVYPGEIEKIATDRADVADASLEFFESPSPHLTLFVIRRESARSDDELARAIMNDLEHAVLKYSLPRSIRFCSSFPATAIGKTDHKAFKE